MEKILFINKYTTFISESLIQKFNGQMDAFVSMGYDVWYIEWDGDYTWLVNRNTGSKEKISKTIVKNKEKYYHSLYFDRLYRDVKTVVKQNEFQYAYMRKMPLFPSVMSMGRELRKNEIKLIYEIPTYSFLDERKRIKSKARKIFLFFSEILEKCFKKNICLYAIMGREEEGPYKGVNALNIKNGINVESIKMKNVHVENNGVVNLIAVASMCYWHGYDRIIKGLFRYDGDRNIVLHMVGPDGDGSLAEWRELARKINVDDKVVFHGKVYGKDLDELFDQCQIAVSTLGLFRQNTGSSGVLKSREYMARGIPFVYAGVDVSFDNEFPYAMQVANNNEEVNINAILSFYDEIKMYDYATEMRQYALDNMSWTSEFTRIMSKVIENE